MEKKECRTCHKGFEVDPEKIKGMDLKHPAAVGIFTIMLFVSFKGETEKGGGFGSASFGHPMCPRCLKKYREISKEPTVLRIVANLLGWCTRLIQEGMSIEEAVSQIENRLDKVEVKHGGKQARARV